MKKAVFLFIIVLVLAGCDLDIDNLTNSQPGITTVNTGRLTITGLDEFNGKYIFGDGGIIFDLDMKLLDDQDFAYLAAAAAINFNTETLTGTRINNGRATLNVWQIEGGCTCEDYCDNEDYTYTSTRFTGNGFAVFFLFVYNSPNINFGDEDIELEPFGLVFPKFNNGVGSGEFTTEIPPEWEDIFSGGDAESGGGPGVGPGINHVGMWSMELSNEEVSGIREIKFYGLSLFPDGNFILDLIEHDFLETPHTIYEIRYDVTELLSGTYTVSANTITLYEGGRSHPGTINGEQITIPGFLKYPDDSPKTAVFIYEGRWF